MSYSCTDLADTVLDALGIEVPEEFYDSPSDQADLILARLAPLQKTRAKLEDELNTAERKANEALGRYKFQMFGYWAAIWVHLNRIGGFRRPNPWRDLVETARRQG